MTTRAEYVSERRRQAWAHGRAVRDALLDQHCADYDLKLPPAPALIVAELLTDALDAKLAYDPLPTDEFARTEWKNGRPFVTINSLTGEIAGAKDVKGIQNVAAWHETIHVVDDADLLREGAQAAFAGFDADRKIVCYRSPTKEISPDQRAREFWAEEAGRAAAVSLPALERTSSFQELLRLGIRAAGQPINGFPLLYSAAEKIGVNISALVKQLTYEGKITVVRESGNNLIIVHQALLLEVA